MIRTASGTNEVSIIKNSSLNGISHCSFGGFGASLGFSQDRGHRPVKNQHDARRDQDAQTTTGTDDAGGQLFVVTGFQQGREGQQSHQGHHGADNADSGGKDRAGHQRRDCHGAGHDAGRDIQAVKQPLHDVRPFNDIAHEQKQRHRDQHVVYHYRVRLVHQQIEDIV
jgi:hypothetical protein